jgi:C4-type Zn-finger protein
MNKHFQTEVKKRADFKCENCGSTEKLDSHHKLPIALGGTDDIENGICLCEKCHYKQHKKYIGDTNTPRKKLPWVEIRMIITRSQYDWLKQQKHSVEFVMIQLINDEIERQGKAVSVNA